MAKTMYQETQGETITNLTVCTVPATIIWMFAWGICLRPSLAPPAKRTNASAAALVVPQKKLHPSLHVRRQQSKRKDYRVFRRKWWRLCVRNQVFKYEEIHVCVCMCVCVCVCLCVHMNGGSKYWPIKFKHLMIAYSKCPLKYAITKCLNLIGQWEGSKSLRATQRS